MFDYYAFYLLLLCGKPAIIMWEVWKARNKAKFKNGVICHAAIVDSIRTSIANVYPAHKLELRQGKASLELLHF